MINFAALKDPFPSQEIKWRVGATNQEKTKGIALAYIDSRAVMDRLDNVCGEQNWAREHEFGPKGEIICRIGIKCHTGQSEQSEWVWRSDGASATEFEAVKGGLSDSFKRAAVSWGIARYLYQLKGIWVPIEKRGKSYVLKKTPKLPRWALPTEEIEDTINEKEVTEIYALAEDYGWDRSKARRIIFQKFNCFPHQLTKEEAEKVKAGLNNAE